MNKTVADLINEEYREYSEYVVKNRAIPSNADGLKPVQRKILYYMLHRGSGKKKVAEIGGSLSSVNYHHGENSANDAVIKMGADWSNNVPLLKSHGNFGSVLVPEPSAARYIFAELSPIVQALFKDNDLCPPSMDPEDPEPAFYLPIAPLVLFNGVSGVAVGFATNILPRDPMDVIAQCRIALRDGVIREPNVLYPSFNGVVDTTLNQGQYSFVGVYQKDKKGYIITQPTPDTSRLAYASYLEELSKKDVITDYEDHCSKSGFCFKVIANNQQRQAIENKGVDKALKISTTKTENIVLVNDMRIDEAYIYRPLDTKTYINDFVKFRLKFYLLRLEKQILEAIERIRFTREKERFILAVLRGYIPMKDLNCRKDVLINKLVNNHSFSSDDAEKLVGIPLYSLNEDSVENLEDLIEKLEEDLGHLRNTDPRDLYDMELARLAVSIKKGA